MGGAPLLGWNSTGFCGLSWEKRAGSQGKGSGCGELRDGPAQLDFFRNYNSNSQNGGVEINSNSTRNLTNKVEISWHSVHQLQYRYERDKKIDRRRARLPILTLSTIWCLFPFHPAVIFDSIGAGTENREFPLCSRGRTRAFQFSSRGLTVCQAGK